eukprot:jgi/Botrbrau1/15701/Bobra.4_1s0074.1
MSSLPRCEVQPLTAQEGLQKSVIMGLHSKSFVARLNPGMNGWNLRRKGYWKARYTSEIWLCPLDLVVAGSRGLPPVRGMCPVSE